MNENESNKKNGKKELKLRNVSDGFYKFLIALVIITIIAMIIILIIMVNNRKLQKQS